MQIFQGEPIMMYIHYCSKCDTIRILSGHKPFCPACGHPLRELSIPFAQYSALSSCERKHLLQEARQQYP